MSRVSYEGVIRKYNLFTMKVSSFASICKCILGLQNVSTSKSILNY